MRRRLRVPVGPSPQTVLTTNAAREQRERVSDAAANFERRWTCATLQRIDRELARRLSIQRGLFNAACFAGTPSQIVREGEALVRGYGLAVEACEGRATGSPCADDDAYLVGRDEATGQVIAIGWQRAAEHRVRELYGDDATWLTPDDVARLIVGNRAFKVINAAKVIWPGAELLDSRGSDDGSGDV